jgi:hypothetical protein
MGIIMNRFDGMTDVTGWLFTAHVSPEMTSAAIDLLFITFIRFLMVKRSCISYCQQSYNICCNAVQQTDRTASCVPVHFQLHVRLGCKQGVYDVKVKD